MGKYYLAYDAQTGEAKGFYLSELHGNIPTPNIEITQDQHDWCMNHDGYFKVDPATLQLIEIPQPTKEEATKAQAQYQAKDINTQAIGTLTQLIDQVNKAIAELSITMAGGMKS